MSLCGMFGFGAASAAAESPATESSFQTGYRKAYRYDDRLVPNTPPDYPDRVADYLFFTNFETLDPGMEGQPAGCAGKYYSEWKGKYDCKEVLFNTGSRIEGPFHSNDAANLDGSAEFGRAGASPSDTVEIDGGTYPEDADAQCTGKPIFHTSTGCYVEGDRIPLPTSTDGLGPLAEAEDTFSGETRLELDGTDNTIHVVRPAANGTETAETIPWPNNNLIYVKASSCGRPASADITHRTDSAEEAGVQVGCGNVYVHGTYSQPLTVAAEEDLIVNGNIYPTSVAGRLGSAPTGTATLGLIAGHYVRIYHPTGPTGANLTASEDPNGWGAQPDIWIYAAILAEQYSMIVDNSESGSSLGELNIYGSVAQNYRGIVGTSRSTSIVTEPPPAACTSRRHFTIHVVKIPGLAYRRISFKLNGQPLATKTGKQLTATIDLRGHPRGTYVLRITVETIHGRKITATRTYHACSSRPAHPKRPPAL